MKHKAGETVECVVTYLEMTARPTYPRPHLPTGPVSALMHAEHPPNWYFLALYNAVGGEYEWTDLHALSPEDLHAYLNAAGMHLYTFLRAGWPHGFFLLDASGDETCDLAYFGLVPQATGHGLGTFLLQTAIHIAWDLPDIARLTVNTNSLDHSRALPLYQKNGFTPLRREPARRVLTRDRNLIGI